ncbi:hypothetical protein Tco_1323896 [Tanacetum coccineum]
MIERYIYGLALQIRAMVAATEPTTIQSVVLKVGMLTDEAIRSGSLRKNTEKGGNGREPSKDGNVRDDNKVGLRIMNPRNDRNPITAHGACFECGGTDHYKAACPRLNRAPRQGGNRQIKLWLLREAKGWTGCPEKAKHLMSAKAEGQKLKDIVVVRNFSVVFPDDLSGLPPSREIKFSIDLIPGAMPVAKSLDRLVPSKMEELSSQLKELKDKGS